MIQIIIFMQLPMFESDFVGDGSQKLVEVLKEQSDSSDSGLDGKCLLLLSY